MNSDYDQAGELALAGMLELLEVLQQSRSVTPEQGDRVVRAMLALVDQKQPENQGLVHQLEDALSNAGRRRYRRDEMGSA